MYRNLTSLEDKYVPTTGLYFLPYEIPYNGTLVEIEVCGFIGEESFNSERNTLDTLVSNILIYRRVNDLYSLVDDRISIVITPNDGNTILYGCEKEDVQYLQRSVNKSDRVAVFVPNPDCLQRPVGSATVLNCFAHSNLVSPNCSLALHFPSTSSITNTPGVGHEVRIEDAVPVREFININITIAGQNYD